MAGVESAEPTSLGDVSGKVVRPADLVLLKLYAGGPKDAWDIQSLLESHEGAEEIKADVSRALPRLPPECRKLWARVLG